MPLTRARARRRCAQPHAAAQLLVAAAAHGPGLRDELPVGRYDARPAAVLAADAVGDPARQQG